MYRKKALSSTYLCMSEAPIAWSDRPTGLGDGKSQRLSVIPWVDRPQNAAHRCDPFGEALTKTVRISIPWVGSSIAWPCFIVFRRCRNSLVHLLGNFLICWAGILPCRHFLTVSQICHCDLHDLDILEDSRGSAVIVDMIMLIDDRSPVSLLILFIVLDRIF